MKEILKEIGVFRSPFSTKFGIPRQSGLVAELRGRVVLHPEYASAEALRGLEEFDYLWIIWGFSEIKQEGSFHTTVRPPVLGGNVRMGVWATRSPFRPNRLGLSSVRIERVSTDEGAVYVSGADLMDGTPVYDIKPYLAYTDAHPTARSGFAEQYSGQMVKVVVPEDVEVQLIGLGVDVALLKDVLARNPRPRYHDDEGRIYAMPFMGADIKFKSVSDFLEVCGVTRI